ncbi:RidA family protein [Caulobacter sp. NIBR2454]|uniref:RidA family protein n=1 Tax=Caulobacter sp. NIBR2454 TaxID=3015996 RepID=UPI0022B6AFF1|nr:RidA family protein [Caulobacter sp. NIBR2454]
MIRKLLTAAALGALTSFAALTGAQAEITRTYPTPTSFIAQVIRVPAGSETIYLSGQLPAVADPAAAPNTIAAFGNTEVQAASTFAKIEGILKSQGLGMGDVVSMTIYLVGDPAMGGKMDFAGMMKSYNKYFGTPEQPNRPTRSTVQVSALAGPGFLIEVEVTAAKAPK